MSPRGVSWAMVQTGPPKRGKPTKLEVLCDEIDSDLDELRDRLLRLGDTSPGFRAEDLSATGER